MPISSWFKKSSSGSSAEVPALSKEDKHQLTMKCMQSQHTVEPVYDVSGCKANFVPDQTFTYCKLLRKTTLLLFDNALTSLEGGGAVSDLITIKVLDIHKNKISSLPFDFGMLNNLVKIDASNNLLKSLPANFGRLVNLKDLNLSNNEFSKVPSCLCALPKLSVLHITGNKIKEIPKEFHKLQFSLQTFTVDTGKLKEPFKSVYVETGFEGLMKHMCSAAGVEYTGPSETEEVSESTLSPEKEVLQEDTHLTDVMVKYMQRKRQQMQEQMVLEKEREDRDTSELSMVFRRNIDSKKQLCNEVVQSSGGGTEYDQRKQKQQQLQIELERQMRRTQDEEVSAYLANTTTKGNMIENMTAMQDELNRELEGIVEVKDSERRRLLSDLQAGEKNTEAVMQEIINATANKNATFVSLLEEQDSQLEELVATAAGSAAEVRQSEVLSAMQRMLAEAVMLEARARESGDKTGWISSLIEDSEHSNLHVQDVLSSRQADYNSWCSMLLHDEECQAAAFKLLLLNNDLKRSNIIRHITQVEQELVRLSSLEQRKALLSVQYGSTTMLHQRKTLVELLKSLLSQKSDREKQLEGWLDQMEDIHQGGREAADYWLVQYQRLMDVKPVGLAKAEEQLEPAVVAVLEAAKALDVIPLFARYDVTFQSLLDMSLEDAEEMGVGPATYATIQRALQHHLASVKLVADEGERVPSAPLPELDDCCGLTAEVTEDRRAPSAPLLDQQEDEDRMPSAPLGGAQYLEAECVICMELASSIVLLPCGHVCVCRVCSVPITSCPMCRAGIYNKICLGGEPTAD